MISVFAKTVQKLLSSFIAPERYQFAHVAQVDLGAFGHFGDECASARRALVVHVEVLHLAAVGRADQLDVLGADVDDVLATRIQGIDREGRAAHFGLRAVGVREMLAAVARCADAFHGITAFDVLERAVQGVLVAVQGAKQFAVHHFTGLIDH
ncbi:MAG: hypothetical protein IPP83_11150 [Flavobacteriales bacterium]|nr:hypothetical protein [Flavobacteriales bacterium]